MCKCISRGVPPGNQVNLTGVSVGYCVHKQVYICRLVESFISQNYRRRKMNFPQKIRLENCIFARAAQLQAAVYARAGRLVSASPDSCLQALLRLYNAFFYEDNWRNFCVQEDSLEAIKLFFGSSVCVSILVSKEYKFDLILGGKNA